MVDRKTWFLISFLSAFFTVYCAALLYSIFPTIFDMGMNWAEGETYGNAFITSANSTISGTAYSFMPLIGTVLAGAVVLCLLVGGFAMDRAMVKTK